MGGTNTSGSIRYATVEVYDPTRDIWTTAAPMPTERQNLEAVSLNGALYVLGGANPAMSSGPELDAVEAYDPATDTWSVKAPMPTPRYAFAAGVLNGSLVVVGGRNNERYLAAVEAYDPVKDHWTTLTELPKPRGFLSSVTMNDTMYLVGGNSTLNAQDPRTDNDVLSLIPCQD